MSEPVRTIVPGGRYDFARSVGMLRFGPPDPTVRLDRTGLWRASRTPDGPGTIHLDPGSGRLTATGWGPGAGWLLDRAAALSGLADDPTGFTEPARAHPVVAHLVDAMPGLRLVRTERVFEELVRVVLGQKVTTVEAMRSYAALVRRLGEPAPGPAGLLLPPDPVRLAGTPYWWFHPLGVERKRADTLRRVATAARQVENTIGLPPAEAARRLTALPGIGPWTAAGVTGVSHGDPDAVCVGDYHLPHQVAHALAGEPRADDARMLELLEPFRGHRARVVRLIVLAAIHEPRRGPRASPRSFARF